MNIAVLVPICLIKYFLECNSIFMHLRQDICKAKSGVCPGGATQNLPCLWKENSVCAVMHLWNTLQHYSIAYIYFLLASTKNILMKTASHSFLFCLQGKISECPCSSNTFLMSYSIEHKINFLTLSVVRNVWQCFMEQTTKLESTSNQWHEIPVFVSNRKLSGISLS